MKKVIYLALLGAAVSAAALISDFRPASAQRSQETKRTSFQPEVLPCVPPPAGIVSWYRAENSGSDAAGSNHLTLQNGLTFSTGEAGQGFTFDGVDDLARADGSASLDVGAGNGLTIEAWISPTSINVQEPVAEWNTGATLGTHLWLAVPGPGDVDGNIHLNLFDTGGSSHVLRTSAVMTAGSWQHIVATYDKASGMARIYRNGIEVASSGLGTFTPQTAPSYNLYLGNRPGTSVFYQGKMDEVSIYSVAISAADATALYNAGAAGKCISPSAFSQIAPPDNLIAWFPADDSPSDIQNGNTNGSMIGNAGYTNAGKVGKAFTFDGNGDYLSVPDAPEQKPVDQLTVEGWFEFDTLPGNAPHLIAKPLRNSNDDSYAMWFSSGDIRIGYRQSGGGFLFYDTGFVPETGVYYHIAYVLDTTDAGPTANTLKLFVNGVQVFSGAAGLPIYYNGIDDALPPHPMVIGADIEGNTPQYFLDGQADEVSLYSRALAPAEIQSIYGAESAGKFRGNCGQTPAGLVSWYTGQNNALDRRSRHDGTLQGGTSYAPGETGQSFNFDGVDDSVDLGTWSNSQDFSVSMWVRPGATQMQYANIIDNNHSSVSWQIEQNSTNTNEYYFSGSGVFTLAPNVWQHLVITHNSSNAATVWVDGVLKSSSPFAIPYNGTQSLRLGGWFAGGRNWNGQMDEVAMFDHALTAAEVQAIYTSGSAGMCKPTAIISPSGQTAWWSGDGNAFDTSGNGNSGTLQNGASFAVNKVGQGFDLDGVNDYISVPDSPAVRPTAALTIEGWFKFDSIAGGTANHMVAKPLGSTFFDSYVLYINDGRIHIGISDSTTSGDFLDTGYAVQTGVWYHIAMTYDDAGDSMKAFVNGANIASFGTSRSITYDNHPMVIGADITNEIPNLFNDGQEDEVSLYDRALTAAEIRSIFTAGIAGKLKSAQSGATSGLNSLWKGEGNANDSIGANSGTLEGGTAFAAGISGQAFSLDGMDDNVSVPTSAGVSFSPASPMTLELWAYRTSSGSLQHIAGKRTNCDAAAANYQLAYNAGQVFFGSAGGNEVASGQDLPLNAWTHLAGTFDGTTYRIYMNGVLTGTAAGSLGPANASPFLIGGSGGCSKFGGRIDEAAIFSRALSGAEIRAIYLSQSHLSTSAGDVTVTFQNLTIPGIVQEVPMDRSILPPMPSGLPLLTYDVATSAVYTGNVDLCFNVPGLASVPPGNLRVYHLENGAWINRTASGATSSALCTTGVTSLSPFAIANVTPSAANVSISGRALTAGGRGIVNAIVQLTDSHGVTRTVQTGSLGYYSFEGVAAGQNYTLSVSAKRFRFGQSVRIVFAGDEITEEDFVSTE